MLVCASNQFCFYSLERRWIQERKDGMRGEEEESKCLFLFKFLVCLNNMKKTRQKQQKAFLVFPRTKIRVKLSNKISPRRIFSPRLARSNEGKIPFLLSLSHLSPARSLFLVRRVCSLMIKTRLENIEKHANDDLRQRAKWPYRGKMHGNE